MRQLAVIAIVLPALLAAGCGLGGRAERSGASLTITRDFGLQALESAHIGRIQRGETVLSLLEGRATVALTRRSVEAINGLRAARGYGWSYWVNGKAATEAPANYRIAPGQSVQWDYHRLSALPQAIVGAYPEPFLSGLAGKRLPSRVECDSDSSRACVEVRRRLGEAGVVPTGAPLGAASGAQTLRVVVAPWAAARRVTAVATLESGPRRSGVFATFRGTRLVLLDASGRSAHFAPPGSGLVAAIAQPGQAIVWVITGSDAAGVERAAGALDRRKLAAAFAVAVTPRGSARVPLER